MFTLITVFFSLLFIALTGWTITTYLVKEDSQKSIKEELGNLFDINKILFVSLKSLIGVLAKYSFPSDSSEATCADSNELDEQLLNFVQPVQPVQPVEAPSFEVPVNEEEDAALSSFSPELIDVITEEDEKVA